jgi:hypothetical protein
MIRRRTRRAVVGATLGAVLVGAFGAVQPAQAAYPRTSFYVSYGNSLVRGELIWYNQSVGAKGFVRAASGCKYAYFFGWAGSYSDQAFTTTVCAGQGDAALTSLPLDGPFPAGGASVVRVRLMDTQLGSVGSDKCTRSGCVSE